MSFDAVENPATHALLGRMWHLCTPQGVLTLCGERIAEDTLLRHENGIAACNECQGCQLAWRQRDVFKARTVLTLQMRGERFTWATITLDDTNGAGMVGIMSDFGSWSYQWPARNRGGRAPLGSWLAKCDDGYLTSKFAANNDFDAARTLRDVREYIVSDRREGSRLTRDEAREEWNLANVIESDGFDEWQRHTKIADAWELAHYVPNRAFTHFLAEFGERMRAACREAS